MKVELYRSIDVLVDGYDETQIIAILPADHHLDNTIIGRVGVRHKGMKTAMVRQLFVSSAHRKNKVGTHLMRIAIDLATKSGCESISLSVDLHNIEVEAFYKKLGFFCAACFDGDLLMTKQIGGAA